MLQRMRRLCNNIENCIRNSSRRVLAGRAFFHKYHIKGYLWLNISVVETWILKGHRDRHKHGVYVAQFTCSEPTKVLPLPPGLEYLTKEGYLFRMWRRSASRIRKHDGSIVVEALCPQLMGRRIALATDAPKKRSRPRRSNCQVRVPVLVPYEHRAAPTHRDTSASQGTARARENLATHN